MVDAYPLLATAGTPEAVAVVIADRLPALPFRNTFPPGPVVPLVLMFAHLMPPGCMEIPLMLLRIMLALTRAIMTLLSLGDGNREHGDRNRGKNGSFEH